jgi:hypothetical protein
VEANSESLKKIIKGISKLNKTINKLFKKCQYKTPIDSGIKTGMI